MDERDFQILVEMMRSPTASYESLGRTVSLSGTAVHNRIDRMMQQGPLTGLVGLPNAIVFGRRADVLWTRPPAQTRDRIGNLLAIDPVVWVSLLHTGEVATMVYLEQDEEPPIPDIESVLQAPTTPAGGYSRWSGRPSDAFLSPLDWKVLLHLIRRPRIPVTELAERSGLARRTAMKRRDTLYEQRLVALFPLLETARAPGFMLYNVVVDVEGPSRLSQVQEVLPNSELIVRHDMENAHGATYIGHAETIAEVTLAVEDVKNLPGILRVKLVVDLERIFAADRVEGWVSRRLQK